jgi:hypothetical protein
MMQVAVWNLAHLSRGIHTYTPQGSHNCTQSFLLPLAWHNLRAGPGFPLKGWFGSALEVSVFQEPLQN